MIFHIFFLQDVNEPPVYLQLSRNEILENAPIGSTVGQLTSSDPDSWNTQLKFEIKSPSSSPFSIGGNGSDSLVTTKLLDHETTKEIEVLIRVTDDGGLYLEKPFTIHITSKIPFLFYYDNLDDLSGYEFTAF